MSIYTQIRGVVNSEEFYGYINPEHFHNQADFILKNEVGEIAADLLDISEFDNPIFMFYKLREF
jgi:hypothetical protein